MKAKTSFTAVLTARGWRREGGPPEEVGECTHEHGCSRTGRWAHPHVDGQYCAQHAYHADPNDSRWSIPR